MHHSSKLFPYQKREIFAKWKQGERVASLARNYRVSRPTIYKVLRDGKLNIFEQRSSKNQRWRNVFYGLKRLSETEKKLAAKIARKEHRLNRYEKSMPGEMVHVDTKRLPLLPGESPIQPREYLFVAIDDYSRTLYADIFPDKTAWSSAIFLEEIKRAMPFSIAMIYSDNGSEYKGRSDHPFVVLCRRYKIAQGFTQVKHPWTNGKAERVIKTLMCEWHRASHFVEREERRRRLYAFVNWYNQSRQHQSLNGKTPLERLEEFIARAKSVNNA